MSAAAAEMGSPLALPEQRKRRRPLAFGAGAVGLLLVGGAITLFAVKYSQDDKASTRHTRPATAAAAPDRTQAKDTLPGKKTAAELSRSRRVVIRLKRLPAKARCKVDGKPVQGNPIVLRRTERPVKLTCAARGFGPFETTLVPDQDLAVAVRMPPLARPTRGSSARRLRVHRSKVREPPPPRRPRPRVIRARLARRRPRGIRARRARPRPRPMRPAMRRKSDLIDDDRLLD
jgi:hypothetical protein